MLVVNGHYTDQASMDTYMAGQASPTSGTVHLTGICPP